MIADDTVHAAAQELIDRYGPEAVKIAKERAARHEDAGDWPAHSVALRVLTEVERLLAAKS
jgi:hypothetical protein